MKSETKNCQNCKKDFTIEIEDFKFYQKIKVPPPTFCPECRFVRRLCWRNERSLYKRNCDLCRINIISMYDKNVVFPVYCPECWRSDKWEAGNFGQNYDFSKTFFEQFKELFNKVPRQGIRHIGECVNAQYANFVDNSKNIYLSYSALWDSENIYYSNNIDKSKEIVDTFNSTESELIYQSINVVKNYNCQYSFWSINCINCNFIIDCANCQDCFCCVNLQNKKYCIENIQYSKEEYFEKMKSMDMGSYTFIQKTFDYFWNFSVKFPKKYTRIVNCINSTGDVIRDSKNCKEIFNSYGCENLKYGYRAVKTKDSMDVCYSAAESLYEHSFGGSENSQNVFFTIEGGGTSSEVEYSDACKSSVNLFGCIGLKNKQYYILNKKYTKEDYFTTVEKIKKQMVEMPYVDKIGRIYKYGEFFPYELSPFGYNETVVNEYLPIAINKALKRGYNWKEKTDNKYEITKKAIDLPDKIKDVDDQILNETIECAISNRAYKITPFELQFYRRMNIPLPRLHQDERYKIRTALRNPMKLWHRKCMKENCINTFETSYTPERPEIVYCEKCYQQEVY